ncbi:SDR family oxidoreductase [Nakamurella sp. YIM 132087]|uniref:SDR family oxidoreductase n=1 Tax=Nakamurella alba TaxID=2665158 RepID=A0A7K1FT09_9ACTN|nr:SDR family oxidoreductase [Nakamurella alba]MTD16313.1 SDR family oxidoreductase [Nakamurella alba]
MTGAIGKFSLEGRTVVLTGATAGIGRRFAHVLVGAGATVALVARRAALLDELVDELGPRAIAVPADLSDPAAAVAAVDTAMERLGSVDVLVNNAAYIAGGIRAEDESLDDITTTLGVNLVAPILMVQRVFPHMKERGSGSVINVSSMVAGVGIGRLPQAVYAASKGGLNAITREWAAQWSRFGIRINAIAPGFIETEMTSPVIAVPKIHDWILSNTLLPRHGAVDDFDGVLLLLAGDAGAYITGQVLHVDGGWTAH